jgi:hypothetical protein
VKTAGTVSLERRRFLKQAGMTTAAFATGMYSATAYPATVQPVVPLPYTEQVIDRSAPQDHGKALVNPDMGWTMHFYSNTPLKYGPKQSPSDALDYFPGLSTVYLRLPLAFIEPKEGPL